MTIPVTPLPPLAEFVTTVVFPNITGPISAKDEARITKVDPCDLKTCAHTCSVINDVAKCMCPIGFHLNEDGYDCNGT